MHGDLQCSSRGLNQVLGGPEHRLTRDPGAAAEELMPEPGLGGWSEKDAEGQKRVIAQEGKAVCKKRWPVPTVSGFGGRSAAEKDGTSEAGEEAGTGAEGLVRQATGLGFMLKPTGAQLVQRPGEY